MADGRHLKIVISPSQQKNHPISMTFCKQQQILNWMWSRDQKWKRCIGQTPSSTERISCSIFSSFRFLLRIGWGLPILWGTKVSPSGFIWNNQNISWVLLLLLKYAKCRQQYRTVQLTAVTFILSTDAVDCAITYIRTWYATSVIASKLIRTANCSHTLHNHETQIKQVNLMLACLCA